MAVALPSLFTVKAASLDTQQRLPYNRQRTKPKKPQNPTTISPTTTATTTATPQTLTLTTTSNNTRDSSISALLSRKIQKPIREKLEETYLGYETWLPVAPKVEKPRSIYNAASLAYIGDCIYELYARRHFLFPPLTIEEYNNRVMAVVRTEAQDAMLQKLLTENYLLEEERDVLRWGKNSGSGKTRTKKRVGVAVYNSASSLETLTAVQQLIMIEEMKLAWFLNVLKVGYLYLTNTKRLEEIMLKLGFSCVT